MESNSDLNDDDIKEYTYTLCDYYVFKFPLEMMNENYEKMLIDEIFDNLIIFDENLETKYKNKIKKYVFSYLKEKYLLRCDGNTKPPSSIDINTIETKLNFIKNIPQPEQRTDEWYNFRYNHLTASNLWKIFGTQCSLNNLIYEKCIPLNVDKYKTSFNENSALSWGHKYEDVSILFYEKNYKTKIKDYGCIPHNKLKFLAASPDGINDDPTNKRYGRMLEIKNIYNRKITGIPKKEYWVQMQIQMEVCNLDECDFLETRFIEYKTYDEFINDGTFTHTKDNKEKGIIIYFIDIINKSKIYEYMDIGLSKEEYETWEKNIMNKYSDNKKYEWINNYYWYLDELSCVLVKRNKYWFNKTINKLIETWDIICKERENGEYTKRAPKKRTNNKDNNNNTNNDELSLNGKLHDSLIII